MSTKDRITTIATMILAGCAVIVTALVVHRYLLTDSAANTAFQLRTSLPERVAEWSEYGRDGHVIGTAGAAVTIVTFSDFECPACRTFASYLPELFDRFGKDLAVVYRHFPMKSHLHAIPAARAAECAHAQGRFEGFHDAVYAGQDSLTNWSFARYAELAGVPRIGDFERCVADRASVPALERDTVAGGRLGVTGTPTLLINGRRLNGVPPLDVLARYVEEELRAIR